MLNKACYDGLDIVVKPDKVIFTTKSGIKEKHINLSTDDVRAQLRRIGCICPYTRENKEDYYSEALERYGLPYMNYIYYYEFYKLQRIPTFNEFYQAYLNIYCDKVKDDIYTVKPFFDKINFSFTEKQLMGRVFRSYNSFHREIDLLSQFSAYEGIDIKYDFQDDLRGIDFTITYKGKTFCLASYVGTQKSYNWKNIKNSRRHDYSNVEMMDIVAIWDKNDGTDNCDCCNGIYVYKPSFVALKYFEIIKRTEQIV